MHVGFRFRLIDGQLCTLLGTLEKLDFAATLFSDLLFPLDASR